MVESEILVCDLSRPVVFFLVVLFPYFIGMLYMICTCCIEVLPELTCFRFLLWFFSVYWDIVRRVLFYF